MDVGHIHLEQSNAREGGLEGGQKGQSVLKQRVNGPVVPVMEQGVAPDDPADQLGAFVIGGRGRDGVAPWRILNDPCGAVSYGL